MKKIVFILVYLVILDIAVFSESFFTYYDGNPHMIGISIVPFGLYSYDVAETNAHYGGGFREIGLSYEYRLFKRLGFEGYADIKGYLYEDYQSSSNSFVRIWGLPNFKIGAGGVLHIFGSSEQFDLSVSFGIEYAHYIADEVNSFPGFGMTTRARFIWHPVPVFGFGAVGTVHYSMHPGGPYIDDPSTTRLPFEHTELGLGLQAYFYF